MFLKKNVTFSTRFQGTDDDSVTCDGQTSVSHRAGSQWTSCLQQQRREDPRGTLTENNRIVDFQHALNEFIVQVRREHDGDRQVKPTTATEELTLAVNQRRMQRSKSGAGDRELTNDDINSPENDNENVVNIDSNFTNSRESGSSNRAGARTERVVKKSSAVRTVTDRARVYIVVQNCHTKFEVNTEVSEFFRGRKGKPYIAFLTEPEIIEGRDVALRVVSCSPGLS